MIDIVVPLTYRLAPQRGGFGFIVAEELHDFSGTMAVFAIESPFGRIVTEKEPCFCGTMINDRSGEGFLVTISQQCFSRGFDFLKNKSISL